MKKYTKPSLTALGLLRDVTKFSGCPVTLDRVHPNCID
jgi:hypothetical protein